MIKKILFLFGRICIVLVLSPLVLLGVILLVEGLNDPTQWIIYPIAGLSFLAVLLTRSAIRQLLSVIFSDHGSRKEANLL